MHPFSHAAVAALSSAALSAAVLHAAPAAAAHAPAPAVVQAVDPTAAAFLRLAPATSLGPISPTALDRLRTALDLYTADVRRSRQAAKARAERLARIRAEREAERKAAEAARARSGSIIGLASREAGDPYVYGAAGPSAFDCSGFTMYVFGQLGISLPHNAAAQAAIAQRVSDPQVGDLVFFGGSHVYHVGIYAGDGYLWHAPHPGDVVRKERIWTGDVFYGRVG